MENQELGEIEKLGELGEIANEISESETIQKPKTKAKPQASPLSKTTLGLGSVAKRGRPKKEVVPKVKKPLTEKQLENLAKGREKSREVLLKKYDEIRTKKQEEHEKYAIKKANRIIEKKNKLKKDFGLESDEDSEPEDLIEVVKPIKPKKKKIITLPPESDSEEEVILKLPPKKRKSVEPVVAIQPPTLKFY